MFKRVAVLSFKLRAYDIPTYLFFLMDSILASLWLTKIEFAIFMTARLIASFASQILVAFSKINLVSIGGFIGSRADKTHVEIFLTTQVVVIYFCFANDCCNIFQWFALGSSKIYTQLFRVLAYYGGYLVINFLFRKGQFSPKLLDTKWPVQRNFHFRRFWLDHIWDRVFFILYLLRFCWIKRVCLADLCCATTLCLFYSSGCQS